MNNILTLHLPFSINLPLISRWKLNLWIFWSFTILTIGGLLVFYIFQTNVIIQGTYLLQGYEEKLTKLEEENEKLTINLAKFNSLENLESLVQSLNYEKTEKIKYIQVIEGQMAKKVEQ